MKTKKHNARTKKRNKVLFGVWLQPDEKQRLEHLAEKTGVDQSKLVRRGLVLLFDAFNRGQLELGFPESVQRVV